MSKENWKYLGIGAGIGLLAGAVVAVLYAPKSGKETRKIVKEKIENFGDKVKTKIRKTKAIE